MFLRLPARDMNSASGKPSSRQMTVVAAAIANERSTLLRYSGSNRRWEFSTVQGRPSPPYAPRVSRLYTITMANGAANSTAIQIQAGSRNHARRRSQPEFVFMASSRKEHVVGWIPADVDSFARVIVAVTARDLGDRVFAALQARQHVHAVAQEHRAGHGGGTETPAIRRQRARDARHLRAQAHAIDPIHGAQKSRHETRARAQVDVLRRAHLFDRAGIHHRQLVGH